MQVDFYQLSRDPAPATVASLTAKVLDAGGRALVVAADPALRGAISAALWSANPAAFLAHAEAGGAHDARQPLLLSERVEPVNGARFLILADGVWRDPGDGFDRVLLLFDGATIDDARATWRRLGDRAGVERRYWRQDGGRWLQGP